MATTQDGLGARRAALLRLAHHAGDPSRSWACAAEGNVSARMPDDRMLVKASGCSLGALGEHDLLLVDRDVLRTVLESPAATDDDVSAAYAACVVAHEGPERRPSVEALLHAVLLDETEADTILHTHPIAVNALLCSVSAELLVRGALFPDQIVMMGRWQVLVPYVDPGLPLARAVRASVRAFVAEHGRTPKVVYLRNHGVFVLGQSADDARDTTTMTVKVAEVLQGALAAGGPVFLSPEDEERIDVRPDEIYRRAVLGRPGA